MHVSVFVCASVCGFNFLERRNTWPPSYGVWFLSSRCEETHDLAALCPFPLPSVLLVGIACVWVCVLVHERMCTFVCAWCPHLKRGMVILCRDLASGCLCSKDERYTPLIRLVLPLAASLSHSHLLSLALPPSLSVSRYLPSSLSLPLACDDEHCKPLIPPITSAISPSPRWCCLFLCSKKKKCRGGTMSFSLSVHLQEDLSICTPGD